MATRKKKARPTLADVKVAVRVDPKRKKSYEELLAQLHAARAEESSGFDDYWEAVGAIVERELYIAGGFERPEDFFARVLKEKPRTAFRMIRVARYATEQEIATYSVSVLDAAIAYIEAKTGGPAAGKLPVRFESLRIPVTRGGTVRSVPLAEAGAADVRRATTELLKKAGRSRATASPAQAKVAETLARVGSLAEVSVHVTGGKVRFGAVPLAALGVFAKALARVKLDAGA